ncbi:alpha/beta hydrolase [Rhodococcus sp. BP-252]|uniref:alpha/beta fold hydrolase n=1 Tax=unclassified Rhodococcus (in: high G+C Gram-positive bacteria) TaxID=192944 RepID=UPI001C9AAA5C|nr:MULTISPECIES: alpha/beta hydrolase [unclassified Rhodococcus (in: high G+C Gram-positive bacteria)]MBY6411547.1 alpha/beta hydrolase [Rhodococcus sp. BP-320]MBY6417929.1 alpha/beta hydrolase [Rhodococcus sp. BP-321]MBY6422170.1 alpha/beta hydrolase [Rhodococcus sp. BP-324]MBY6427727.1 alpha/beta hydrolase [Rhodococcus sp. BP-323]MBY6433054.1 alpha/beta hydrolase [Rhodococcus sp. BP-322]
MKFARSKIAAVTTAIAASLTFGAGTAVAQDLPTVVLVHGAFADASSWDGVAGDLRARGYDVVVPDNPLRGPGFDSDAIEEVVNGITGPVVLVGHSYGGTVITNVHSPNVESLVYVAAFVPAAGEPAALALDPFWFGLTSLLPPVLGLEVVEDSSNILGKNVDSFIEPTLFKQYFAPDVSDEQAAKMIATQKSIAAVALVEPSEPPSWAGTPSWALIPQQDQIIPPASEKFMAERAGAKITEVPGSHAILVSNPGAVVDLVIQAS